MCGAVLCVSSLERSVLFKAGVAVLTRLSIETGAFGVVCGCDAALGVRGASGFCFLGLFVGLINSILFGWAWNTCVIVLIDGVIEETKFSMTFFLTFSSYETVFFFFVFGVFF